MNNKSYIVVLICLVSFLANPSANAHGNFYFRGGYTFSPFYFGTPYYAYPYYPMPYTYPPYYFPPAVSVPQSPPDYVEQRSNPQSRSLNPNVWLYCAKPKGFYPQLQSCPNGWEEIRQQPDGEEPGYWYYCNNPSGYYPYIKDCKNTWQKISP